LFSLLFSFSFSSSSFSRRKAKETEGVRERKKSKPECWIHDQIAELGEKTPIKEWIEFRDFSAQNLCGPLDVVAFVVWFSSLIRAREKGRRRRRRRRRSERGGGEDALVEFFEDLDVTKVVEDLGGALVLCEEFRPEKVCEIVVGVFPFSLLDRVPDVFRVEEHARLPLEPGFEHVSARKRSHAREKED